MSKPLAALLVSASILVPYTALAQQPATAPSGTAPTAATAAPAPLQYGQPITLQAAKKVLEAADAEAARNNWPVVIAVVDTGGHLVAMQRRDNAQIGSIRVAEGKARTAVEFLRPTKALEDFLAGGGAGLRVLSVEGLIPTEGGILIQSEGKVVGAIGVSGVTSSQDAQVARAGAEAALK